MFFDKDSSEILSLLCRSSRPDVFCKKGILRNFTKFTGKHLIKIEALAQVFSGEFCEISKNAFSYRAPPVAASDYGTNFRKTFTYTWVSVNIVVRKNFSKAL